MKQTTRRKYYAKSAAGGALNSAIYGLKLAIDEAGREQPHTPLYNALQKVAKDLQDAAESFDVYAFNRKRLQNKLKKQLSELQSILQELHATPVTQEEKLAAKVKRKKAG